MKIALFSSLLVCPGSRFVRCFFRCKRKEIFLFPTLDLKIEMASLSSQFHSKIFGLRFQGMVQGKMYKYPLSDMYKNLLERLSFWGVGQLHTQIFELETTVVSNLWWNTSLSKLLNVLAVSVQSKASHTKHTQDL